MSTDPIPEMNVDESGLVPPQSTRPSEWPKKLRTLTAAELDRLTIDNNGRFYWDGKLVNYEPQPNQLTDSTSDALDRSMDIIDRATHELRDGKTLTTIEGELAPPPATPSDGPPPIDLEAVRAEVAAALAKVPPPEPSVITTIEQKHVTLSGWQKLGAIIVVVAIAVGAFGIATYGYVAARDWGCRTGAFQNGCPAEKAAPRPDIPA